MKTTRKDMQAQTVFDFLRDPRNALTKWWIDEVTRTSAPSARCAACVLGTAQMNSTHFASRTAVRALLDANTAWERPDAARAGFDASRHAGAHSAPSHRPRG